MEKLEMQAMYKCRMCGELHSPVTAIKEKLELIEIINEISRNQICRSGSIYIRATRHHDCHDGSIGVSDFIGFKPEKE